MIQRIFKKQTINDQAANGNLRKSLLIFFIGTIFTFILTILLALDVKMQNQREFELVCSELKTKIETRLYSNATLLRNCASLFAVSDTVTREEWKLYISYSNLESNLPGIEGVGYSHIVHKDLLQKHIETVRKEGFPDYQIKPSGLRELYTTILYIEPFSDRNLRAFGYDMYSEPVRRKAMEFARDFNVASLSGKVILVQESGQDLQAGTLMYIPVYKRGMNINSTEERRKAIIGWVYSPYRMNDLMNGILGRWDTNELDRIRLQIFDENIISDKTLLFDSRPKYSVIHHSHLMNYSLPLTFNSKQWVLNFSQPEKKYSYYKNTVLIVFTSGFLISILLFALFQVLSKATSRLLISEELAMRLKESEEKYRALVENANEAIFVIQNQRIVFANKACELITGISLDKMKELPMNQVFVTEQDEKMLQQQSDLTSEKISAIKSEFLIKNQKEIFRWILINSVRITWNGSAGTLNMAIDITERKENENLIVQKNEELQNLNATKDKFFSIIAHDLRGPLSTFLGATEFMAEQFSSLSLGQIQDLNQSMLKSATNLFRLLENLLQWSHIQRGTISFNPISIPLSQVVEDCIEIAQEQALAKSIKITSSVPNEWNVIADTNMLQTVLRNLLSNAIKFTPKGGDVSISAMSPDEAHIVVSISDTGIGMSPAIIENLFNIGGKTNRAGTENEPSSGLGLLLCKEFIEKNNGQIWVKSEMGKGSTISFSILKT